LLTGAFATLQLEDAEFRLTAEPFDVPVAHRNKVVAFSGETVLPPLDVVVVVLLLELLDELLLDELLLELLEELLELELLELELLELLLVVLVPVPFAVIVNWADGAEKPDALIDVTM